MRQIKLKNKYNEILMFAKYDVKNLYTEEQLLYQIKKKAAKRVVKHIHSGFVNRKQMEDSKVVDLANQMMDLIADRFIEVIEACYKNNIVVNFIDLPTGIYYDTEVYMQKGLVTNCFTAMTMKMKEENAVQQFVKHLIQNNTKQLFLYQIYINHSFPEEGWDGDFFNVQENWSYYIRFSAVNCQCAFTTEEQQLPNYSKQNEQLYKKILDKIKIGNIEIYKTTEAEQRVMNFYRSLEYHDEIKFNINCLEDLQDYHSIDAEKQIIQILKQYQINCFCKHNNIDLTNEKKIEYMIIEDVNDAKKLLSERYIIKSN